MQKNMFFVVVLALRFIIKLRFPNDVPISFTSAILATFCGAFASASDPHCFSQFYTNELNELKSDKMTLRNGK